MPRHAPPHGGALRSVTRRDQWRYVKEVLDAVARPLGHVCSPRVVGAGHVNLQQDSPHAAPRGSRELLVASVADLHGVFGSHTDRVEGAPVELFVGLRRPDPTRQLKAQASKN